MKKIKSSVLALCTLGVLSSACIKVENAIPFKGKKKANRVDNSSRHVNQIIGDERTSIQVLSETSLKEETLLNKVLPPNSPAVKEALQPLPQGEASAESISEEPKSTYKITEESLLIGLPIDLIGEQSVFGGVITKVSDSKNEELGSLKLTDLTPVHVRTVITGFQEGKPSVTLVGCAFECEESSTQVPLVSLPIVGFDRESKNLIINMSAIGKEFDLVSMLDPKGEYTKLKAIESITTNVEYSVSTLVFDVKTKMIPVDADANDPNASITEFTVRWYLKLNSTFNPAFNSRAPTPGVGFFTTDRGAEEKITRFSTTNNGSSVHYFIKNVPQEWRKVFASAFDNWNVIFKKEIGRKLLSYEFLESTDPRHSEIVAGDIRHNVLEWDLENLAGYGGLGPSIANQFTGETLSANVLIQGPKIMEIYTKWFGISKEVHALKEQGLTKEANTLIRNFNVSTNKELSKFSQHKFSLKLGKKLIMNVNAQRPELQDPMIKGDFEIVPKNVTFEEYMTGYFTEMLEHELGHNLGLRHNFKGNLGAIDNGEKGTVSRSIMEYLGRGFRHLSGIGLYDKMAIAYGYKGIQPKHLNWFCTDEDQGSTADSLAVMSPECSKNDATSDPFSYFEARLARAIELLIDTKSSSAPIWKVEEINGKIEEAVIGLSAYALSAEKTASSWTNFFGKSDRPEDKSEVKDYVLNSFKKKVCDPKLSVIIANKENPEAAKIAESNLSGLKKAIADKTVSFGLYTAEQFDCE